MIQYPIQFFGQSDAGPGIQKSWSTEASGFAANCSVPKEFEGDGTFQSPEDFFLLAVQNCFIATFKVYAHYSKLTFNQVTVEGELEVNKTGAGNTVMKSISLKITLSGVSDEKKSRLLVDKTLAQGFIIQSVKSEIKSQLTILP